MRRIMLAVVALTLTGCGANSENKDDKSATLEAEAKEAVSSLMKDPQSTTFQNLSVDVPNQVVCGEMNSKNSYGAYAGVSTFVYADGSAHIEDDSDYPKYLLRCTLLDKAASIRNDHSVARLTRELKQ